jgi:glycosyltransferase involved in cell wall biosynthesis
MRALVVTNMFPSSEHPARGSFVADQVAALRRLDGVELEVFVVSADGAPRAYVRAARELRGRYGRTRFDVVHAHFGLSLWPALAARASARAVTLHGTDLAHPRSRAITLAGLPSQDLVATVSEPLAASVPRAVIRPGARRAVLPCGVETRRFRPLDRTAARAELGLDPGGRYLLFPADPARPEKRYDRAVAVAGEVPLLTLREVEPAAVPLWVNAANAVLVPSEREGFGLAVLEALACDVPVLATPAGIAPEALAGIAGAHCGPFRVGQWRAALAPHLASADPRIDGRAAAERYSADPCAADVLAAWRALVR